MEPLSASVLLPGRTLEKADACALRAEPLPTKHNHPLKFRSSILSQSAQSSEGVCERNTYCVVIHEFGFTR
jgi:hypothetical protein